MIIGIAFGIIAVALAQAAGKMIAQDEEDLDFSLFSDMRRRASEFLLLALGCVMYGWGKAAEGHMSVGTTAPLMMIALALWVAYQSGKNALGKGKRDVVLPFYLMSILMSSMSYVLVSQPIR